MYRRNYGASSLLHAAMALMSGAIPSQAMVSVGVQQMRHGSGVKNYHKHTATRYDGEELRRLRAERGVGSVKRVDADLRSEFRPTRRGLLWARR